MAVEEILRDWLNLFLKLSGVGGGQLADKVFADKCGGAVFKGLEIAEEGELFGKVGLAVAIVGQQDDFVGKERLMQDAKKGFEIGVGRLCGEDNLFGFGKRELKSGKHLGRSAGLVN